MRKALFKLVTRLTTSHPLAVLAVAVLLSLLSLLGVARIEVRTSFKDTMSPDEPVVRMQRYVQDDFPGAFTLQLSIEGSTEQRMIEVARELEKGLLADPEQVRAVWLEQPIDFFVQHGLLFLSTDELRLADATFAEEQDAFADMLADPSVLGLLRNMDRLAASQFSSPDTVSVITSRVFGDLVPQGGPGGRPMVKMGVEVDDNGLRKRVADRTLQTMKDLPLPPSEPLAQRYLSAALSILGPMADALDRGPRLDHGQFHDRIQILRELDYPGMGGLPERYTFSPDRSMLLMEVCSTRNTTELANIRPFMAHVQAVVDEIAPTAPDVHVGVSGVPALYLQETEAVTNNLALVTVLGFLGVMAVFVIGFERVSLPSLAAIPLVMGVLWTIGAFGALVGVLDLFSMVFPVLLVGLGVDFAIHIISAYTERRTAGDAPEAAVAGAFDRMGDGLLTGGLTTAVAFGALLTASFQGTRSMGLIACIGVVMALLSTAFVMPALLVLWDRRQKGLGRALPDISFGFLARTAGRIRRQRYPVLAVFLVATITFAYFVPEARLDRNAMNLEPDGMPAVRAQDHILEVFGYSSHATVFVAEDLAEAERIRQAAERSGTIGEVVSASAAIPADQDNRRPLIEAIGSRLESIQPAEPPPEHSYDEAELEELRQHLASLKAAAIDLSLISATLYGDETEAMVGQLRDLINRIDRRARPAASDRFVYLDTLIRQEATETYELFHQMTKNTRLEAEDLPGSIRERLQGRDGRWMVLVKARGDVWEEAFLNAYISELQGIGPEFTGMVPIWHRMLTQILADLPRLVGFTLAAVVLLVLLDLRSLKGTLLALTPLLLAIVWTIGAMAALGVQFNVVSILAIPLIVGIGIDAGVHLYHRIRIERRLAPALAHSGKAIVLTTATTAIGFGSLLLSVHRGFYYLGLTVVIGLVSALILSLFLLPALVAIFEEEHLDPEDQAGD